MKPSTASLSALAAAAALLVPQTAAAVVSFDAQIHCAGWYDLDETIPYGIELTNETPDPIDVTVQLLIPTFWFYEEEVIKTLDVTVPAETTRRLRRALSDPDIIGFPPLGWITFRLIATTDVGVFEDTCVFYKYWSYVP